jgi:hypothetical protein
LDASANATEDRLLVDELRLLGSVWAFQVTPPFDV